MKKLNAESLADLVAICRNAGIALNRQGGDSRSC